MIKLYYSNFANFGDALNKLLFERLSGRKVLHCGPFNSELMGVGSIFYGGGFFWGAKGDLFSKARLRFLWRRFRDLFRPTLQVWGSGMLFDEPTPDDCVHYRKMKICAVRGKETVRILKRAGFVLDESSLALGDPGLLYPDLIPGIYETKKFYDLAIVPHYLDYEIGVKLGKDLAATGVNVKVIDVMQPDPLNVIREIAAAKKVASASLHGLIVSDSLDIPNRHLVLSDYEIDRNHGQGAFMLKFKDYYSSLGVAPRLYLTPTDFDIDPKKAIESIDSPAADKVAINKVKMSLLNAFPTEYRGDGYKSLMERLSVGN